MTGQDLLDQGVNGALVGDVAGPAVHRGAGPGGQLFRRSGAARRLASTTAVPAWARAAAMARPSPAEPPVTTATCPPRDSPGAAGPAGRS